MTDQPIVRYTGIYNADGGLVGEVRYVVGHLLGTAECALCDITHSPVRRKRVGSLRHPAGHPVHRAPSQRTG